MYMYILHYMKRAVMVGPDKPVIPGQHCFKLVSSYQHVHVHTTLHEKSCHGGARQASDPGQHCFKLVSSYQHVHVALISMYYTTCTLHVHTTLHVHYMYILHYMYTTTTTLNVHVNTHLASKECESVASWLEELQHSSDERAVAVSLQVGLETDKGALLLRGHMHREVGVTLGRGRGVESREMRGESGEMERGGWGDEKGEQGDGEGRVGR